MPTDRKPRICLAMVAYGNVAPEVLEDWGRFLYHCGRRMPQYEFFSAIRTKSEQFRARNAIVDGALEVGCDWLLMLDDDMIINAFQTGGPSDEYNFLEKLIAHDKDICGVLYYQRTGECRPVLMKCVDGKGYRFLNDDEITHGLQQVDVAGGGCLLMKMRIFDHIKPPYFAPEFEYGTDVQLARKALAAGYEVWADTSIELGHLRDERVIVTSHNRVEERVQNKLPGEVKRAFNAEEVYNGLLADIAEYTGYRNLDDLLQHAPDVSEFLETRHSAEHGGLTDADWYRLYPNERIVRQAWFNIFHDSKRVVTGHILGMLATPKPVDVLDFGCGIGIPAFEFAKRGHRVTACDIRGTGTFEFLKWRVRKHDLRMTFHDSEGGIPRLGDAQYDVIVAMDAIEHVQDWRRLTRELARHVKPGGVLFSNNGILADNNHPEHYSINNQDFLQTITEAGLLQFHDFAFVRKPTAEDHRAAVQPPAGHQEEGRHAQKADLVA